MSSAPIEQKSYEMPPRDGFSAYLDWVRWVADEIMPKVA